MILLYTLFALTTAFTSLYEILMPVIRRRKETFKVENELVVYITFFSLSFLIAPLIFSSCIIPSMGDRFRNSLYDGLFDSKE
jgi:hypothetical protein